MKPRHAPLASTLLLAAVVACGSTVSEPVTGISVTPDAGSPPASDPDAGSPPVGDAEAVVPDANPAVPPDATPPPPPPPPPLPASGHAAEFANQGDAVHVGVYSFTSEFTIEAWVRPGAPAPGAEMQIVAKEQEQDPHDRFRLGMLQTGELFFAAADANGDDHGFGGQTGYALKSTTAIPLGVWTHVAVVKSAGDFALIVNADVVATLTTPTSVTFDGGAHLFDIGARTASDGVSLVDSFVGAIDEVRVWSVARPMSDIVGRMSGPVPLTPTLVSWWGFDEGQGTVAHDSAFLAQGTLINSTSWVISGAY